MSAEDIAPQFYRMASADKAEDEADEFAHFSRADKVMAGKIALASSAQIGPRRDYLLHIRETPSSHFAEGTDAAASCLTGGQGSFCRGAARGQVRRQLDGQGAAHSIGAHRC